MNKNYFFKTHFLIILIFISGYTFSQKNNTEKPSINTLFQKLKVKPNNTKKVDDLISLYKKTVYSKKPNEQIIDEAIAIAEKIYYIDGLANCYNRKGLNARHENDFTASISHHKRALNLLSQSTDTLLKIKCLNSLGVAYRKLNLEKEAFDVYFEALDLSERFKNSKSIAIALNGIGNVFIDTKEYDKALYYFRRDYQIELNRNNTRGQEYCLSNIGEIFLYKKRYDSAYIYLNNALSLTKKHKRKDSEAIQYNLLGLLFQNKKEYSKSTEYYQKAIPILTNANNLRYLSNTLINIGVNQLYSGKTIDAFENISIGLKNAKTIKSKENIILGYNALVEYYTVSKNYKKALQAHKNATTFQNTIINEASQKSIISTEIEYQTAKKDRELKQLAIENNKIKKSANTNYNKFLITFISGICLLVILGLFFYLYQKNSDLRLERRNSELQNYMHQISYLKEELTHKSIEAKQQFFEKYSEFDLSKREIEVLTLIAKGYSNIKIAEVLFVSKNTIKSHIKNIYLKLDVKNRIQALKKVGI